MKLVLLGFPFLLFGSAAFAATKKEDIVRQYYHSAQKSDFVIAQKVLESCKECNKAEVMKEALAQAKTQKDAESAAWISSELTLEELHFAKRNAFWLIPASMLATLLGVYYFGFPTYGNSSDDSDF